MDKEITRDELEDILSSALSLALNQYDEFIRHLERFVQLSPVPLYGICNRTDHIEGLLLDVRWVISNRIIERFIEEQWPKTSDKFPD